MSGEDLGDRELLDAFEACTLEPERFGHREHVRVAWLMLGESDLLGAIARFRTALVRYATRLGQPGKYHETMTWAFVILIHERKRRPSSPETWPEFAAANPDLLVSKPSVLDEHYSPELLGSDRARARFVLPDRAP